MKARALLVGINCYPKLGDLEGPENDVDAMQAWLTSPAGGLLDSNKDITRITTLTCYPQPPNKPLTRVEAMPVMSQIYYWLDKLEEEASGSKKEFPLGDRVYLFFSGHGHHADGKTALFMANAWANDLGQAIPMQQLSEYIRTCGFFSEVILIADACRAQMKYAADPYFSRKVPQVSPNAGEVRQFDAFPCVVGQNTIEDEFNGKKGGVLTNAFLTGVNGLAAQNGAVTSTSLKGYMINAVAGKLRQDPDITASSEAKTFTIANAPEKKTRLTVTLKQGSPPGDITLIEGASNAPLLTRDLSIAPITEDLRPGWYILRRDGQQEILNVAWETTDVQF